jgi:hypothetical protein
MGEINLWVFIVVPSVVASGIGALISIGNDIRKELKKQVAEGTVDGNTLLQKVRGAWNADPERMWTGAIGKAIIWGGIVSIITGGLAMLAGTLKGANEMKKTYDIFTHGKKKRSEGPRQGWLAQERKVEEPARVAQGVPAGIDRGNCRQWLRMERGRRQFVNGKVRIQPLGRQQVRAPVKTA